MELLLNEKSLDGQFARVEEFYKTLPEMSRNLKALKKLEIPLLRHSTLYQRKITAEMTLFDLKSSKDNIAPEYRDQVRQWKRELSALVMNPPFWDIEKGMEEEADSLQEAALRRMDVLSFDHEEYRDVSVCVTCHGEKKFVKSAVSFGYLTELLWQKGVLNCLDYLKMRFANGRVVLDNLDKEKDSVSRLQKSEIEEILEALERFNSALSWDEIQQDRFFYYKSYKPASKKADYFAGTEFGKKNIDKFRCGQHSQVRCFGYREEDRFYILMVERDHSVSDTG